MNAATRSPGRVGGIDALRGLAALAVFLFHLNIQLPPGLPGALGLWRGVWQFGYLGVPVFFVISGLCIGQSWLKADGPADFGRARARRIFPPYWASLVLIAAVATGTRWICGHNDVAVLPRTLPAIAATGLLLTDPLSPVPAMSAVYWSLSCEIAYYAVMAVVLFVPRSSRLPALALLHGFACLAAWPGLPRTGWCFPLLYWPLFGAGVALALRTTAPRWARLMFVVSGLHAAVHLLRGSLVPELLAAGATVALLATVARRPDVAWPRWLVWTGGISYSLYIVHATVGLKVFGRFWPPSASLPAVEFLRQAAVIAATLAVCAGFHRYAERPWMHRPPRPRPA